jgi:hypothetical protein
MSALLPFLHGANKPFERRSRHYPVKLGAIVVNEAYVIDDDVMDFPIFFDKVHFVTDKQILGAVGNDPGINLRGIRSTHGCREPLSLYSRGCRRYMILST